MYRKNSIYKISYIIILSISFFINSCKSQEKEIACHERIQIFEQIWNISDKYFYDSCFNGIDWEKKQIEYKNEIEKCKNHDTYFLILNKMLFELNSSHCGVGLISEFNKHVSPYIFRNGEIGIDIRIIDNQIVITNVLNNSSADSIKIKPGYIIKKIEGLTLADIQKLVKYRPPYNERNQIFHQTTEVLRHLYGQSKTDVEIEYLDENKILYTEILTRTERQNGISLGGMLPPAFLESKSYFISEDIGYLTFNAFIPDDLGQIINNYDKVSNSNGLIIDLRGNDGGSVEGMKTLLGRFVSERIMYGTYINRYEQNVDFIEPTGNLYKGKVVILVDEMSISGAENMAGIFQYLEIGKVIGKRTPGQLLWGKGYLINDTIALSIPIYKLEYPNGYNPENNGIVPDIEVELKQCDLLSGEDTQLEKAINYLENIIFLLD